MRRSVAVWFAIVLLGMVACLGCKKRGPASGQLAPLALRDDTPNLLLTWIDEKGDAHLEQSPTDVGANGRGLVRVIVEGREDGTGDLFYVADLTKKRKDGTYSTRTMQRREWEAEIETRRAAFLAHVAPPPKPIASEQPAGGDTNSTRPEHGRVAIVIYGASWCGACHQAADYLKSKGIPFVLKDVEETPGAAAEMQQKLTRVGRRGGSIPVIDVGGQILVGFSPGAVDQAIRVATAR